MAKTPVRDPVIWARHIHGEDDVWGRLVALRGGETIDLVVDGVRGTWRKMSDGKDGRRTNGIRPIGAAQAFWKELYDSRRGELVELELAEPAAKANPVIYPALGRTPEERQSALERLLSFNIDGRYSSEGRTMTRDEMHER